MSSPKDVGEYFDHVRDMWEGYGCVAETVPGNDAVFEYEVDTRGRTTGRGHLLTHITFPGFPNAYLDVDEWLVPKARHIEREIHAYDLIVDGARVESWHRHEGSNHQHKGVTRISMERTTLQGAIEASFRILESGLVSDDFRGRDL